VECIIASGYFADSLHLGRPMNNLDGGNEERLRKRMQLILLGWCMPCGSKDNRGWLKFSVVRTQNFTLEYIIASGYFADFFSSSCLLSHCSRLEVFNIGMRVSWTQNFLWSLIYLAFRKWRQLVHQWWTGAHHVSQQRKLRPVRVSQSTLSELSSYINYINLSGDLTLLIMHVYFIWQTEGVSDFAAGACCNYSNVTSHYYWWGFL